MNIVKGLLFFSLHSPVSPLLMGIAQARYATIRSPSFATEVSVYLSGIINVFQIP